VIGHEEPTLRRRFGPTYDRYRATVGRWCLDGPDDTRSRSEMIDASLARNPRFERLLTARAN
jgi:hypothetical protein